MIHSLPRFRDLVAHFPDHDHFPTPALLESIGGEVRARIRDGDNTCAIRLSYTLNKAGAPVRMTPGLHMLKSAPQTVSGTAHHSHPATRPDLYLYRVLEMKQYLVTRYGQGVRLYNGYRPHQFKQPTPIRGATQGIIAFTWEGPFNAFSAAGHMALLSRSSDRRPSDPGVRTAPATATSTADR
jgi:hypothetical protein